MACWEIKSCLPGQEWTNIWENYCGGTLTVTVLKQLNSKCKLLNYRALSEVQSFELDFVAGLTQLAKLCSLLKKNLWIFKSQCYTVRSIRNMGGWGSIYFSTFLAGTWEFQPNKICISFGSSLFFFLNQSNLTQIHVTWIHDPFKPSGWHPRTFYLLLLQGKTFISLR